MAGPPSTCGWPPDLRASITTAALSLFIATACTVGGIDPLQTAVVVNGTDRTVVVYLDYPDGETSIMELEPGQSDSTNFSYPTDRCAPATLIARDAGGSEVDRVGETFCVGERWEIQD